MENCSQLSLTIWQQSQNTELFDSFFEVENTQERGFFKKFDFFITFSCMSWKINREMAMVLFWYNKVTPGCCLMKSG